jgi:hypothetical protein
MIIDIVGYSPEVSRKETRYLLEFYGKILLGVRLAKNVYIEFRYKRFTDGSFGESYAIDDRYGLPREFAINVDPDYDREIQMRSIAHEMEHVRQYARGELKHTWWNHFNWMGMPYRLTLENYPFTPWEKQASRSEGYLLRFYDKHCKMRSLSF